MSLNVILLVVHVCLALAIISLILLQKGKGAAEGASFGGGATTVFGATGSSNFLSKTTAILATGFFINSLVLAYLAANREAPTSVVDTIGSETVIEAPVDAAEIPLPAADTAVDETVPMPVEAPADDALPPAVE